MRHLLIAIFFSTKLFAAASIDTLYQVEVLAFERTNVDRILEEDWPDFVGQINTKDAFMLDDDTVVENNLEVESSDGEDESLDNYRNYVQQTPEKDFSLAKEIKALKLSAKHNVLAHRSWLQYIDEKPKSVHFKQMVFDDISEDLFPTNVIEGVMNVSSQHNLLHANLDIIYSSHELEKSNYRIKQNVRMKSGESYYLDHPLVGLLIKVKPYQRS